MFICRGGFEDLLRLLIEHDADVKVPNSEGKSAMDYASTCAYSNYDNSTYGRKFDLAPVKTSLVEDEQLGLSGTHGT